MGSPPKKIFPPTKKFFAQIFSRPQSPRPLPRLTPAPPLRPPTRLRSRRVWRSFITDSVVSVSDNRSVYSVARKNFFPKFFCTVGVGRFFSKPPHVRTASPTPPKIFGRLPAAEHYVPSRKNPPPRAPPDGGMGAKGQLSPPLKTLPFRISKFRRRSPLRLDSFYEISGVSSIPSVNLGVRGPAPFSQFFAPGAQKNVYFR